MKELILVALAIVAVGAGFWGIIKLAEKEPGHVEFQRSGNTFWVQGYADCDPNTEADCKNIKNAVAGTASRVCGEADLETEKVFKIGDLRLIVTCKTGEPGG